MFRQKILIIFNVITNNISHMTSLSRPFFYDHINDLRAKEMKSFPIALERPFSYTIKSNRIVSEPRKNVLSKVDSISAFRQIELFYYYIIIHAICNFFIRRNIISGINFINFFRPTIIFCQCTKMQLKWTYQIIIAQISQRKYICHEYIAVAYLPDRRTYKVFSFRVR